MRLLVSFQTLQINICSFSGSKILENNTFIASAGNIRLHAQALRSNMTCSMATAIYKILAKNMTNDTLISRFAIANARGVTGSMATEIKKCRRGQEQCKTP